MPVIAEIPDDNEHEYLGPIAFTFKFLLKLFNLFFRIPINLFRMFTLGCPLLTLGHLLLWCHKCLSTLHSSLIILWHPLLLMFILGFSILKMLILVLKHLILEWYILLRCIPSSFLRQFLVRKLLKLFKLPWIGIWFLNVAK